MDSLHPAGQINNNSGFNQSFINHRCSHPSSAINIKNRHAVETANLSRTHTTNQISAFSLNMTTFAPESCTEILFFFKIVNLLKQLFSNRFRYSLFTLIHTSMLRPA
jgi:hypothetical protein